MTLSTNAATYSSQTLNVQRTCNNKVDADDNAKVGIETRTS